MKPRGKAVVTGGSGALGSSVTSHLAAHGYDVHIADRSTHSMEKLRGGKITRHHIDLTKEQAAIAGFQRIGGPIVALVATVGGFTLGPISDVTSTDIDHMASLNLKTTFLTLKAAYPYLKESPTGAAVVLLSSRGAANGGPGSALYAATKAAVSNLALSAAQEWLHDGISVNAVLPSIIDTPANRGAMPTADFVAWPNTEQIANVIDFLVSPEAHIVSGASIPLYGAA